MSTNQCEARNPNAGGRCQRPGTDRDGVVLCPMHVGWLVDNDELIGEPATGAYRMCKCSHTNHVHADDLGCVIDGCSCEGFDHVDVDWIGSAVTLDQM